MLHRITAIADTPGMPEAIGAVLTASAGKVCRVCGLERFGHGPESEWLGHEPHPWDGITATDDMIKHARSLSREAYRIHNGRV